MAFTTECYVMLLFLCCGIGRIPDIVAEVATVAEHRDPLWIHM